RLGSCASPIQRPGSGRRSAMRRRRRTSPLFPYTTLFRSRRVAWTLRRRTGVAAAAAAGGPGPVAAARADVRPAGTAVRGRGAVRSEEHTSELQSRENLVCRHLLEKKNMPDDAAARYGAAT